MPQKSYDFFPPWKSVFEIKTRPRCGIPDRKVTFLRMRLKLDCCLVTCPLTQRVKDSYNGRTRSLMIRTQVHAAKHRIKQKPFLGCRAFLARLQLSFKMAASAFEFVAKKRIFERFSSVELQKVVTVFIYFSTADVNIAGFSWAYLSLTYMNWKGSLLMFDCYGISTGLYGFEYIAQW